MLLVVLLPPTRALRGLCRLCLLGAARAGAEEQQIAMLLRELAERHVRGRCRTSSLKRSSGVADQPAIAAAPTARSRPAASVFVSSGTTRAGSKSNDGAQALTALACAVRRVERERARRHLRNADAAVRARQPPREQSIAAVQRVDDHDVVGQIERDGDRVGQPPLDARS